MNNTELPVSDQQPLDQEMDQTPEISEEELALWNALVDDREGCSQCIGCVYCLDTGSYDPSGEI